MVAQLLAQRWPYRFFAGIATIAALSWPITAIAAVKTLPVINGIRPGRVNYLQSETQPRPKIERAILAVLPDAYTEELSPRDRLRYYYNRIDLNGDRRLETIVYVVGRSTCSREGCLALIFTQSPQGLLLVNQFTAVQTPILVLDRKTAGWQDLVFLVSGDAVTPRYSLVQFNGQTYADSPARQPTIPPNTHLRGTAVLADPLRLTNGLPLRTLAELPVPAPRPDNPNLENDPEDDGDTALGVRQP